MVCMACGNTSSDGNPWHWIYTAVVFAHPHRLSDMGWQVKAHSLQLCVCVCQYMSHGQTASHGGIMTNAVY